LRSTVCIYLVITFLLRSNARAFTYLYISYHDIYKLLLQRTDTHLVYIYIWSHGHWLNGVIRFSRTRFGRL
jgi:hypothetical protein